MKCVQCKWRCSCGLQFNSASTFKSHRQQKNKRQKLTNEQLKNWARYISPLIEHAPSTCASCLDERRCEGCRNRCTCAQQFKSHSTIRDHLKKARILKKEFELARSSSPVLEATQPCFPMFVGHLPETIFPSEELSLLDQEDTTSLDRTEDQEVVTIGDSQDADENLFPLDTEYFEGTIAGEGESYLELLLGDNAAFSNHDDNPRYLASLLGISAEATVHQTGSCTVADSNGIEESEWQEGAHHQLNVSADDVETFTNHPELSPPDLTALLPEEDRYQNIGNFDATLEEEEEQLDHAALDAFFQATLTSRNVDPSALPSLAECPEADCTKKVHCTRKNCACKMCVCKKAKEICDSRCRCNNETCTNRPRPNTNPFQQWTRTTSFDETTQTLFAIPEFDDTKSGPTEAVPQFRNPIDAFYYFVPHRLFDEMASATTLYAGKAENWQDPTNIAAQPRTNPPRRLLKPHRNGFRNFQIKAYIAIILMMGMVQLPEQQDYWSTDPKFENSWIKETMSKAQWKEIHRFFSFDVWKLQEDLNVRFRAAWRPFQFVAVDEGMIPFKGHFGGRQHVPTKLHSTGIKYFGIADSAGYLWSFWIYRGKDFHQELFDQGDKQFNSAQPSQVIVDFMTVLLQTYQAAYVVICDSFFGSLHLAIALLKLGCHFILATKSNRPSLLWTDLLHKGLKKSQMAALQPPIGGLSFMQCLSGTEKRSISLRTAACPT